MTDTSSHALAEQHLTEDPTDLEHDAAWGFEPEERASELESDTDSSAPRGARARKGISKSAATKAIAKYIELAGVPAQHRELLGTALGVKPDAAELAASIIAAPRVNLSALNDVMPVVDAATDSAYAAMFAVFKLDRDQLKQVWAFLVAAGLASGGLPAKDSSAALAVAEAAAKVGDAERELFDSVRELARR